MFRPDRKASPGAHGACLDCQASARIREKGEANSCDSGVDQGIADADLERSETVVGPLKGTQGQDGLNVEVFLEKVAYELLEGRSMFLLALLCIASEVRAGAS